MSFSISINLFIYLFIYLFLQIVKQQTAKTCEIAYNLVFMTKIFMKID